MTKNIILLTLLIVALIAVTGVNAADLLSVNYLISGDSLDIDTLQLEPEFEFNSGQPALLNLAYDGDDLHLGAGLGLNIMAQPDFKLDLNMLLTDQVDNEDFGKGIGVAASTLNKQLNFYLKTYYFIDDGLDDHVYYRGGVTYRLGQHSDLDLSISNQYWDLDEKVMNIGIKYKL